MSSELAHSYLRVPDVDFSDYVLTGAGLCGSVLANKLSAAGHSVLVIERVSRLLLLAILS